MNGKKYKRDWEPINLYLQRIPVPGGWVLNKTTTVIISGKQIYASESMVFVPDPEQKYELED